MKPYNSFDQQNNNNGTENIYQNAHLRNMDNDFLAVPYPFENQIMDIRTPPGPPGPSYGDQPPPRPPHGGGPPHIAPPLFTPQLHDGMSKAMDTGSIKGCLYKHTYVWLKNGRSFWFYPTYVGYNSVAG
ncbi:hypothetical protein [Peribacillus frigoritolerans]|uniref:hypothetical protein n=2 Tax=Peribacillus TaxID=2675229 RepID=UPI0033060087